MPTKKAVNLSVDETLLARARSEGINLSAALEEIMRARISSIEAERWKRENAEAIASYERRIREDGLAGEEYRRYG